MAHHQKHQMDTDCAGMLQASHQPEQAEESFAFTEFALNSIAFASFQSFQTFLLVVDGLVARWPSQLWTINSYVTSLAVVLVGSCPLDFVCQDSFRVAAMLFFVVFNGLFQIIWFVVSIQIQMFYCCKSIDHAQRSLGFEFDI